MDQNIFYWHLRLKVLVRSLVRVLLYHLLLITEKYFVPACYLWMRRTIFCVFLRRREERVREIVRKSEERMKEWRGREVMKSIWSCPPTCFEQCKAMVDSLLPVLLGYISNSFVSTAPSATPEACFSWLDVLPRHLYKYGNLGEMYVWPHYWTTEVVRLWGCLEQINK